MSVWQWLEVQEVLRQVMTTELKMATTGHQI
jgi:hypothetical protein